MALAQVLAGTPTFKPARRRRGPVAEAKLQGAPLTVALEADGIGILTLNRPDALNALNADLLEAVRAAAEDLRGKAKGLLVTGAGKAFAAGADIQAMADFSGTDAAAFSRRGQAAFQALTEFPGPVVAALNGYALGGGLELALACDVILASEKAVVGQPEAALGVVPGFGGSQRLPRRVGPGRAKWLLMTGEKLKADDAVRIGLVDRVVPHDQLMVEARRLLDACLQNGPLAVGMVKRLVDQGLDLELPAALELEAGAFGRAFDTADQKEGMKAFLEKRRPSFKGR